MPVAVTPDPTIPDVATAAPDAPRWAISERLARTLSAANDAGTPATVTTSVKPLITLEMLFVMVVVLPDSEFLSGTVTTDAPSVRPVTTNPEYVQFGLKLVLTVARVNAMQDPKSGVRQPNEVPLCAESAREAQLKLLF